MKALKIFLDRIVQRVNINLREHEYDVTPFVKDLVHNFSHDPETLEKFCISSTIAGHFANIHGSPTDGSFLGPFATVDLTTMNDCVIGAFSYVQAGEINHLHIGPGTVWVRNLDNCSTKYLLMRVDSTRCFRIRKCLPIRIGISSWLRPQLKSWKLRHIDLMPLIIK